MKVGMPLAEARSLVVGVEGWDEVGLETVSDDPVGDVVVLGHEARRAWAYTPLVAMAGDRLAGQRKRDEDPRDVPDTLFLNVTGCAHLHGNERGLAASLREAWRRRGLSTRVAIASSPGVSWAVAHGAEWLGQRAEPLVVPQGREEVWMARLPIEVLALERRVETALRELDLRRVRDVTGLPRGELKRRFGEETLRRIGRAMGTDEETLRYLPLEEPVTALASFEQPVSRRDWLEDTLADLITEVARQLVAQGRRAWSVVCRIRRERSVRVGTGGDRYECVEWVTGLVSPTDDPVHLWQLVRLQQERRGWPNEVVGMEVRAEGVVLPGTAQETLFDADADASRNRAGRAMGRLLERLASRLGENAVNRPVIHPTVIPESVVTWQPVANETIEGASGVQAGRRTETSGGVVHNCRGPARRPLRLLPSPNELEVMAVVPDGPPVRILLDGAPRKIVRCWGPERIETGWWDGVGVARDYYRVETEAGEWYWLFRQGSEQASGRREWYMHGVFE